MTLREEIERLAAWWESADRYLREKCDGVGAHARAQECRKHAASLRAILAAHPEPCCLALARAAGMQTSDGRGCPEHPDTEYRGEDHAAIAAAKGRP